MYAQYCSCGYRLFGREIEERHELRNVYHENLCRFSLETCPHCGAPIGIHLVH